mgnify:CR=1 FL=1
MATLNIIYYTGTGNTADMAKYIGEGAENAGGKTSRKTTTFMKMESFLVQLKNEKEMTILPRMSILTQIIRLLLY